MQRQNLGDMLIAANLIDEVQMQIALSEQKRTGKRFGSTLVDLKFIDENVLAAFLSRQMDVPCISLSHVDIPKKALRKMNREVALGCHSIPVRIDEHARLEVAMVDPTDVDTLEKLEKATGMTVSPLIAPESSIQSMIERHYPLELSPDDTMSVRQKTGRTAPNDPVFWDVIADLDNGDLDARLSRIEENLDRVWVLLEKVLRTLEMREAAQRERTARAGATETP